MAALNKLEDSLAKAFKGLPQMSASARESLAKAWPWIALVAGILQLIAALLLWQVARVASSVVDYANSISLYYTGHAVGPTGGEKTIIYLGVLILLVEGVLMLMAYSPLKARARRGWDLLFLAVVVNVLYAVVQLFTYNRGLGSFLFSLLGSAFGFYLLLQVREKFGGKKDTV